MNDDELWSRFQETTLPAAEWTHEAHLRIAWMHAARFDLDEGHLRFRAAILRLNATHGIVETPARGYHETLTRVWLRLVRAARAADARAGRAVESSTAFCAAHPELSDRELPLRFYSRERLFSVEARAVLVEPDRDALP